MTAAASLTEHVTLALWATNLGRKVTDMADWAAHVDAQMATAAAKGAKIFVLPEYASEQWLAFKPDGGPQTRRCACQKARYASGGGKHALAHRP